MQPNKDYLNSVKKNVNAFVIPSCTSVTTALCVFLLLTQLSFFPSSGSDTAETTERAQRARGGNLFQWRDGGMEGWPERVLLMGGRVELHIWKGS